MSPPDLRVHELEALEEAFDRSAIIAAVRQSFVDQYEGRFHQAKPVHLVFGQGDCHIKSGFVVGGDTFLLKIATGFYENEKLGLPTVNGLMIVSSQETGAPLALLRDRGMLTAWRTAAATVVAALAARPAGPLRLGLVGAGLQAELAADWLRAEADVESIKIWSRQSERRQALAGRLNAEATSDLQSLCSDANLIITATPATEPLIRSQWIFPGTHIVCLGADTPGKVEVDPALFARAAMILTDDHDQCLDHGDFGSAVRSGAVLPDADTEIGEILAKSVTARRAAPDITIADLTGLAVQDNAIASLFLERLA